MAIARRKAKKKVTKKKVTKKRVTKKATRKPAESFDEKRRLSLIKKLQADLEKADDFLFKSEVNLEKLGHASRHETQIFKGLSRNERAADWVMIAYTVLDLRAVVREIVEVLESAEEM